MTEAEVDRIGIKLENLEDAVKELKDLILREIAELKIEQIADVRRDNERLADDQRRLWDAVRSLESARDRAHGGGKVLHGILIAIGSMVTSSAAAVFLTRFFK